MEASKQRFPDPGIRSQLLDSTRVVVALARYGKRADQTRAAAEEGSDQTKTEFYRGLAMNS